MKAPSEKHLEDWIVDNNEALPFGNGDFHIQQRQLPLPSGRLDLLGYWDTDVSVIEIKRESLTSHSLAQVLRYMHDLKRIWRIALSGLPDPDPGCSGVEHLAFGYFMPQITGILIGYDISDDILTAADAANVEVLLYDYVDGEYTFDEALKIVRNDVFEPYAYGTTGNMMREAYLVKLMQFFSDDEIARMNGDCHAWDRGEAR